MANAAYAADKAAKGGLASSSAYERLGKLEKSRVRRGVVALAFVLMLPGVLSGFSLDDYVLLDELSHADGSRYGGRGPFELFRWIEPGMMAKLIEDGGVSWWLHPDTQLSFMRPLSSLTHVLDHWLWPHSPLAMHVHNLLWFGLLLLVTFRTYRELMVHSWALGLACAMFALDSAHAGPVGWIANRNGLISAAFAVACLFCHHRARSARSTQLQWGWGALAAVSFVTCMLAAELGVGMLGYLLAYAVLYERGSLRGRLLSLSPYVAVLGAFSVARARLGYGVMGGFGNYIDPLQEPLRFLRVLPIRATMLLSSQLSRFCSDLYEISLPPVSGYMLAAASGLLLLGVWFVLPALRTDRVSRFLFAGAVLSAIPPAGATASERLLLLVGFGIPPVLAEAVRRTLTTSVRMRYKLGAGRVESSPSFGPRSFRHGVAGCFLLAHLVVDPILLPLYAAIPGLLGREADKLSAQLPLEHGAEPRTVIVTSIPDPTPLYYTHVMRKTRGEAEPERLYWLSSATEGTIYTRIAPNALRVSNPDGFWDVRWEERSPKLPFRAGDRLQLTEMSLHVVEVTRDGRPAIVDFAFREPLESPRYAWVNWHDGNLEPFVPPKLQTPEYRADLGVRGTVAGVPRR